MLFYTIDDVAPSTVEMELNKYQYLAQGLRYAPDDCLFKTFSEEPLMVINTDGSYINLSGAKKSERESQGDFLTVLKSISFPDGILNEANELINSIENRLQFRLC